MNKEDIKDLHPLVLQLTNADQRESALLELSKKREAFPDLAPVLWHSFGTISALLQEILSIYPMLSPPTLSPHASNRVCNALALLQCVASHHETKSKLMNGGSSFAVCMDVLQLCNQLVINHCVYVSVEGFAQLCMKPCYLVMT